MKRCLFLAFLLVHTALQADFSAFPIRVMISEKGNVSGYLLTEQENKYELIPPSTVNKVNIEESEEKLTLTSNTSSFLISLQFTTNFLASVEGPKLDAVKARIMERYPHARILESGITYTGNGEAYYCDIQWGQDPYKLRSKIVIQELQGQVCEFIYSASKITYASNANNFGIFLTSFKMLPK